MTLDCNPPFLLRTTAPLFSTDPQRSMQKSIETDELFALGTEPTGKSVSLYSFYKVTENDSVLCITAEGWADGRWRPKQLRVIENLDSNPRRDIKQMDCYAEIDGLSWGELVLALNNADTCRLDVNDKLDS